jgi:formyl-CoA transferase
VHGVSKASARRAPEIGEHNEQILKELGFDAKAIEGFRASGVVPAVHADAASKGGKR